MTDPKPPQPSLPLPDFTHRANEIAKRASKERRKRRLPVLQGALPIADRGFAPVAGVPKTRGECPTERPCPYVKCRHHLFMEDAEHRSGRPGLGSVPRDKRGLTLSVSGDAGRERPGTTLRPGWLKVKGLEVEREVRLWVHEGELNEASNGALDYWLRFVRVGEPLLVFDDDTAQVIAKARLVGDGELEMDRELSSGAFMVVLTRVREVSSCALDLIDRHGKLTNEQTGNAVGRHRTLVAREVRRALAKAIATAEQMGMSDDELMRGLMELGAENR